MSLSASAHNVWRWHQCSFTSTRCATCIVAAWPRAHIISADMAGGGDEEAAIGLPGRITYALAGRTVRNASVSSSAYLASCRSVGSLVDVVALFDAVRLRLFAFLMSPSYSCCR